eukprot:UN10116
MNQNNSFICRMQYFEIWNDLVHDLLTKKSSMTIQSDISELWDGFGLKSLTREQIHDFNSFAQVLKYGMGRRTTIESDYGPYSEKSSSFLIFDIEQITEDETHLYSKVIFAELPSSEKWKVDFDKLT